MSRLWQKKRRGVSEKKKQTKKKKDELPIKKTEEEEGWRLTCLIWFLLLCTQLFGIKIFLDFSPLALCSTWITL